MRFEPAFDLEVAEVHSFYVAAGSENVLVHNECLPELRDWQSRRLRFGRSTYLLDKSNIMTHILTRHRPRYWDRSAKRGQTFFDERLTIADVKGLIDEVARQNRDRLVELGMGFGRFTATIDGTTYVLGVGGGHFRQFYPLPVGAP